MTNETKHTPSPWTVAYDDNWYICAAPGTNASTSHPTDGLIVGVLERDDATARADASLIAAAPDLLAALRDIVDNHNALELHGYGPIVCAWCGRSVPNDQDICRDSDCLGLKARAAIARAVGGER